MCNFYSKNQGHEYLSKEFKEFQLTLIHTLPEGKRQEYEEWKVKVFRFIGLVNQVDSQPTKLLERRERMRIGAKVETLRREIWKVIEGENQACSWEELNRLEDM